MKIQFWGAAREVTGSKHLLKVNGKQILLDCGLFQGHRKEADEKNHHLGFDPKELDAVILSHAHIDHCGDLPLLIKDGYKGPIYSTFATRDLCNYMLLDSAFIQQKDAEYLTKHMSEKKQKEQPIAPLYTADEAKETLTHFYGVGYEKTFEVCDGVTCSFYDAGHILGSSLVYLDIQEKNTGSRFTFTFTGDLGRKNLPILRDPRPVPPSDYFLSECTYGDRLHDPITEVAVKLEEIVNVTAKRGGKIFIPAFSMERTQEIVYELNELWQKKSIPDLPIFVDSPLSANLTEVFMNHPECFDKKTFDVFINNRKNPFGFGRLKYTQDVAESKALNVLKGPAIIISASGMCENGRILHHLKNGIEDPRNTILIVGYMAKDTLGRAILEKRKVVKIYNENYQVRAEVKVLNAFSAHADRNELMDYISHVKDIKKIFLVHGEEDQGMKFKGYLKENGYKDVVMPTRGQEIEIPQMRDAAFTALNL